jgi:hypothetical protein
MRIMKPSTEVERTMIGIELAREVVNDLQAMKHYEWEVFDLTLEGGGPTDSAVPRLGA